MEPGPKTTSDSAGGGKTVGLSARVDPSAGAATFEVTDSVINPFAVRKGDRVRWSFAGVPEGWRVRIRFDPEREPLLDAGRTLEGGPIVTGGAVRFEAPLGTYSYGIDLVAPDRAPQPLRVVVVTVMADGERVTETDEEGELRHVFDAGSGATEVGGPPDGP
jgi:hypothetical protein